MPILVSFGVGGLLTLGLLSLIAGTYPSTLATLMLERGVYQHLSLFLAASTAVFILGKCIQVLRAGHALRVARARAALPDWRPEREVDAELRDQLLGSKDLVSVRQARALQAFLVTGSRSAAAAAAEEDANLTQQATESGYSMPRALIWAIPLMGFIGTVVGISGAVANFSDFLQKAQEIDQIKQGINGVTTGLAIAFDTTFVALALSVLVMLPLVLVERWEVRVLGAIDAFIGDSIVARLPEADRGSLHPDLVSETLRGAIKEHLPSPHAFVSVAEAYMKHAAETIAASARESAASMTQSARTSAEEIRQAGVILRDYQLTALGELRSQAQQLARPLAESAAALQARLADVGQPSQRTEEAILREQEFLRTVQAVETSGDLRRTLSGLESLLQRLVPTLDRLGQPREFTLLERSAGNGAAGVGHGPGENSRHAPR